MTSVPGRTSTLPEPAPDQRPPHRGWVYLVSSYRLNGSRRERVTRLFRQQPAALRYAEAQHDAARGPVRVLRSKLGPWRSPWE